MQQQCFVAQHSQFNEVTRQIFARTKYRFVGIVKILNGWNVRMICVCYCSAYRFIHVEKFNKCVCVLDELISLREGAMNRIGNDKNDDEDDSNNGNIDNDCNEDARRHRWEIIATFTTCCIYFYEKHHKKQFCWITLLTYLVIGATCQNVHISLNISKKNLYKK